MTLAEIALAAAGSTSVVAFGAVRVVLAVARRRGFLDHPSPRSSHEVPTPKGGGLGVAAALGVVLPIALTVAGAPVTGWLLFPLFACCAVGLYDDLRAVPPGVKMLLTAVAVAPALLIARADAVPLPFAPGLALGALAVPLTVFWLAGYVNAFNFMDGIDGIAAITTVVCGGAFAVAGVAVGDVRTALFGAVAAGAALGFLPWNFPRARIFLGDAGSLPLGLLLAAAALTAATPVTEGAPPALPFAASVLLLGPFLFDVAFTLTRRALGGRTLGEAHREHVYQRLCRMWGHARVSLLYGGFSVLTASLALAYAGLSEAAKLVSLTVPLLLMLGFAASVLGLERRRRGAPREGE